MSRLTLTRTRRGHMCVNQTRLCQGDVYTHVKEKRLVDYKVTTGKKNKNRERKPTRSYLILSYSSCAFVRSVWKKRRILIGREWGNMVALSVCICVCVCVCMYLRCMPCRSSGSTYIMTWARGEDSDANLFAAMLQMTRQGWHLVFPSSDRLSRG